ncbi:hypothetical protein QJ857_gp0950 [Tupanvirus soda lake]|uniref:Uncharacterized protein n=2 Tax=Tupanvirus TaxID=2094720 RepID=A0A6N1NJZ3_9VIRU|nr:hypothetical protein QJ857_gp0950 [Tupanvirus soda lake]QKU35104.1 hypothetical protein [Tupanvirus soda lake]
MQSLEEEIITKGDFDEMSRARKDYKTKTIAEKIKNIHTGCSYSFGKYVKFLSVPFDDVNFVCEVIKNTFFETDILFNVKVINYYILFKSRIYIKFYDPTTYPQKVKKDFNQLLFKHIKNDDSKILYIKGYIDRKNWLKAQCYTRNFNMILGQYGYKFSHNKKDDGLNKYHVYTIL